MHISFKCKILRRSQRHLRGDEPLDDRIICKIEEHRDMIGNTALLKCSSEKLRDIILDAHRGKYNAEPLIRPRTQRRLCDQLGCQLIVRQSVAGENRQLLSANKSGQTIDGRNTRIDIIARILAPARVERHAVHVDPYVRDDRSQPVDRSADAVKRPAQNFFGESQLHRVPRQFCMRILQGHAIRPLEDLDDGLILIILNDSAELLLCPVDLELDDLVVGCAFDAFQNDQGTVYFTEA